jgi:hypothetical protein
MVPFPAGAPKPFPWDPDRALTLWQVYDLVDQNVPFDSPLENEHGLLSRVRIFQHSPES